MAQRKSGPFLLPARVVLVIAGAVAVALGSVNLFHEWRAAQVDNVYVAAAAAVGVVWLLALITAFRGWRASVFITALTAFVEFGVFAAAVLASVWLAGGLWISRVRRTGAVLILVATFGVWYSFVTLHLVSGGTSVQAIAKHSGLGWAAVAAAAAVLAAASFIAAIGILVWSIVRNPGLAKATKAPVRRRA